MSVPRSPDPPRDPAAGGRGLSGVATAATHRLGSAFAWAAWLVAVVTGAIGAVYVATDQGTGHPVLTQTPVSGLAGALIAATYATVGLLLVLRRPGLIVGWLFLGIGVVAGLSNYAWGYVWLGSTLGSSPGPFAVVEVAWSNNALTYSTWAALAILLILLFPDGRSLDRAWNRAVVATVAASIVLAVGLAIEPGPMRLFEVIDNPRSVPVALEPLVAIAIDLALLALVLVGILSLWGLIRPLPAGRLQRAPPAPLVRLGLRPDDRGRGRPDRRRARRRGRQPGDRPQLGPVRGGLDDPADRRPHRDPAGPPLRHRPADQPDVRVRCADRAPGRAVLGAHPVVQRGLRRCLRPVDGDRPSS